MIEMSEEIFLIDAKLINHSSLYIWECPVSVDRPCIPTIWRRDIERISGGSTDRAHSLTFIALREFQCLQDVQPAVRGAESPGTGRAVLNDACDPTSLFEETAGFLHEL